MRDECQALEKQLEKRHTYVTQSDLQSFNAASEAAEKKDGKKGRIEGYLFKRGQNAFRTWNRRWFYLSSNKLCYSKRNGEDVTVIEEDLRICLVRPINDIDRRFCFEVISPTKSHVLQADSEEMYTVWLTSLQQGISSALHEAMDSETGSVSSVQWEDSDTEEAQDIKNRSGGSRTAKQILDIPGNEVCADCGAQEPQWASINFGVTLCIECGGIHRSLGVHITKVRSITLDLWEPEILKVMAELGNNIVNKVLEGKVGERVRPGPEATRSEREAWITEKYKEKSFVNKEVFKEAREVQEADAWTVKRLRRRARGNKKKKVAKTDQNIGKESLDQEEKDIDTCQEEPEESSLLESVLRASTLAGGSTCPPGWSPDEEITPVKPSRHLKLLNTEVCVFGGSLGKHHVASVQLDSDQESTDGEEAPEPDITTDSLTKLTPEPDITTA